MVLWAAKDEWMCKENVNVFLKEDFLLDLIWDGEMWLSRSLIHLIWSHYGESKSEVNAAKEDVSANWDTNVPNEMITCELRKINELKMLSTTSITMLLSKR